MADTEHTYNIPYPEIPRTKFVGRRAQMEIIHQAISDAGRVRVVNIQGKGGIGKTSILNEVIRRYKNRQDILITQLIDFFDITMNTHRGFLDKLISVLPENSKSNFEQYQKAKNKAEQIESAGLTGEIFKEDREKVFTSFIECFNQLSELKRIIILIDTFEMTQEDLRNQIAEWLPGLKNTAVIIAGRNNNEWQNTLEKIIPKDSLNCIELEPFDMEEAFELLKLPEKRHEISNEELQKIHILSQGIPILLILAVDRHWPKYLPGPERPQKECTRTSERYTLDELRNMTPENLEHARKSFRQELVSILKLERLDHQSIAILLMSQVYKYFTAEMFSHLENLDKEKARDILKGIEDWAFIKYNPNTGSYWLHDLLREMIIEFVWVSIDAIGNKRKEICSNTAIFYDNLLKNIEKEKEEWQSKRKKFRLLGDKDHEIDAQRKITERLELSRNFQAHKVYYQILGDYQKGIETFQLLFEYNLWVKDKEANKILISERDSGLRISKQTYPENNEQIEKAMDAFLIERRFDDALDQLSNQIRETQHPYLYALIRLYQGIASNFKAEYENAKMFLEKAIEIFESIEKSLTPNDSSLYVLSVKRSLSRAYGNMGYGFMMAGRLTQSVEAYEKALPYSKAGNIDSERAYQLNDLGYAYACLGEYDRARSFCDDGLRIRENMLFEYPIGLSYNNRGIIEYLADFPDAGKQYCEKALEIFKRVGDKRGIGLANRALGGILSRIGERDESREHLEAAEKYLNEALGIFIQEGSGIPLEPAYMAETYQRMGLMYMGLRRLLKTQGIEKHDLDEYYRRARFSFQRCINEYERAKSVLRQANAIGKLVSLYIESDELESAEIEIEKMTEALSKQVSEALMNYSEKTLNDIKNEKKEFLHSIGRLQHLKASLKFSKFQKEGKVNLLNDIARHFVTAYAFLVNFSIKAFQTELIVKDMGKCLKNISEDQKKIFIQEIEKIKSNYPQTDFSELFKRIKDIETMTGKE